MSTLKVTYVAAAVILTAFNSAASGQAVFLTCMEHESNQPKGTPQSVKVDFDRKLISTPVGNFQIIFRVGQRAARSLPERWPAVPKRDCVAPNRFKAADAR